MAKEVEITINADGTSEIELHGFQGKGCTKVIDDMLKSLGGKVLDRGKKCEFFKPEIQEKVKATRK